MSDQSETIFAEKCKKDFLETHTITVVDPIIPPTTSTLPHQFYTRKEICCKNIKPRAPIVATEPTGGITFTVFNLQFFVRATAVDTNCKNEIAIITMPPFSNFGTIVTYACDLAFTVISSTATFIVNGTSYNLSPGGFIYIKAGSPFSFSNASTEVNAIVQLTAVGSGFLGFFADTAKYQEAVGGINNVDICVVIRIAKPYCIFPPSHVTPCADGSPIFALQGYIILLPLQNCPKESENPWGLSCCELLVITAITTEGIVSSVTINRNTKAATIILLPTVLSAPITATIIRDPDCGTPEILRTATLNSLSPLEISTSSIYTVRYNSCLNNVEIASVSQSASTTFFTRQIQ